MNDLFLSITTGHPTIFKLALLDEFLKYSLAQPRLYSYRIETDEDEDEVRVTMTEKIERI